MGSVWQSRQTSLGVHAAMGQNVATKKPCMVEKLNMSKWPKSVCHQASVFTQTTYRYSIKISVPPVRVKKGGIIAYHCHRGPWDFTQQSTAIIQKLIYIYDTSITWLSAVQRSLDKRNVILNTMKPSLPLVVEGSTNLSPLPNGYLSSRIIIIVLKEL